MPASQSLPRLLALVAIAAAVAVVGLVATDHVPRLPGGESKNDAAALIQAALDDPAVEGRMKSGKVHLDVDVNLTGVPAAMQSFVDMRLNSAFTNRGVNRFPKLDMEIVLRVLNQSAELGVASRDGKTATVTIEGRSYSVPSAGIRQFERAETRDPENDADVMSWLKNPSEAESVVVGGVETTRITAELDSVRMIDDIGKPSPGDPASEREFYTEARSAVRPGRVELFIGKDDGLLRRALLDLSFSAPRPGGGPPVGGDLKVALDVDELNRPQRIEVPSADRPYSDLANTFTSDRVTDLFEGVLDEKLSRGFSGRAMGQTPATAGAPGGATPSAAAEPDAADEAATAQASSLPSEAQAYLGCVRRAASQAALQGCSSHLP